VHVNTDPELKGPTEQTVSEIVSHVMKSENKSDADLSYIFGNDDLLNGLKKEFFYKDQFTDVIAFRLNDYEEENVEGEVYISTNTFTHANINCKTNAKKR
jgi:ssRNA-specific RNase YbeY (16S rRNA maturation enzyme)